MNIWERYPSKGTHYETMKAKAGLKTFEYYVHYGRDRDDWLNIEVVPRQYRG